MLGRGADRAKRWAPEMALLGLNILVYRAVDQAGAEPFVNDSYLYLELAENLRTSGRMVYESATGAMQPDFTRTPVYPLIIAGAGVLTGKTAAGAVAMVLWLQRIAWLGCVLFLLPPVRSGGGRLRGWALLGKIGLLFSPVVILHASLVTTDILYAAGVLAGLRLLAAAPGRGHGPAGGGRARNRADRRTWMAGLWHGMLTLLRPIHGMVPVMLSAPWIMRRRRTAAVFLLVSMLLPLLWMTRNALLGQPWTLASIGGINLAVHQTRPLLEMSPEEFAADPQARQFVEIMQQSSDRRSYVALSALVRDGLSVTEADAVAGRAARITMAARPGSYLAETLRNLRRLVWSPSDTQELLRRVAPGAAWAYAPAVRYAGAAWGAFFIFFLPGFLLLRRVPRRLRRSRSAWSLYLATAFLAVVPALTGVTYGRFALPLLPFVGLVYGCAISQTQTNRAAPGEKPARVSEKMLED